MVTAILADDEEIVRTSISKWIPWQELGIKLAATASDGEEAYDLINRIHPDIVITDIRMPKLDGLELIKKVHSKMKDTLFIILSGFGEFEYAQTAMRYGVKHYMLKPALKEDLIDNLKEVKAEVENLRSSRNEGKKEYNGKYIFYLQRSMMMEILSDPAAISDVMLRSKRLIPFDSYEVLTMMVSQVLEADRFVSLMIPAIKKLGLRMPVFPVSSGGKVFIILDISSLSLLDTLRNEISLRRGVLVDVVRGTPEELARYFVREIGTASEAAIYDEEECEIVKIHPVQKSTDDSLTQRYRAALSGNADPSLFEDMEKVLRSRSLDDAESLFVRMAIRSTDYELVLKELGNVRSIDDLIFLAKSLVDHKVPRARDQFPIETIVKYINTNFSNPDISLKWISENVVYMNPEYLSRLFQKEMGQRFTDYLNTTRVDEARKLMSVYHQSTVSEIAEKVGYSNPGYFFHIFRRYTGMTPGEYMDNVRKNYMEGGDERKS